MYQTLKNIAIEFWHRFGPIDRASQHYWCGICKCLRRRIGW